MYPTRLAELRRKHRIPYRHPFPDLSTPPSPCTCGFGPTLAKPVHGPVPGLTVSHLHKQGYQVLSREDVQYAGRKV